MPIGTVIATFTLLVMSTLAMPSCDLKGDRPRPSYRAGAPGAPVARGFPPNDGPSDGPGASRPADAAFPAPDRFATHFAVIGDFGQAGPDEEQVANLVKSWRPDFIVTTGDNNYPSGGADTIDANIGQYFHEFIFPYVGSFGGGAVAVGNQFFPALGNHDWEAVGARPYLDYFQLPGNERYYDTVRGDVHLFAVDSDPNEPDGVAVDSLQAVWLRARLAASSARWRIVYMHHPPYSSGPHGSTVYMQWPFKEWGANIVLAGHDHDYERLVEGGLSYIVNGLGGRSTYVFGTPIAGSQARSTQSFGALLVDADATRLRVRFLGVEGILVDQLMLIAP